MTISPGQRVQLASPQLNNAVYRAGFLSPEPVAGLYDGKHADRFSRSYSTVISPGQRGESCELAGEHRYVAWQCKFLEPEVV
jgi:hypothetical protein